MRVLYVNSGLGYGGAETQLVAIMQEMHRRGHQLGLYLLTRNAPRADELTSLGIPVTVDNKTSKFDIGVLSRLRKHILQWKPDLIHGFLFDANLYARVAAGGCGVPVLNAERSHGYRHSFVQSVVHRATRWLASGVVANTHAGREFAQMLFNLPEQRTHAVWNGIDLNAVDERLSRPRPGYREEWFGDSTVKMATLVGTIKPEKDHLLALQVAERLFDLDACWRVAFVGASYGRKLAYMVDAAETSMRLAEDVERRHAESPYAQWIRFVGQRTDALEIIAASDVLFSTSVREGFPNVVLEAMACGVPVVSSDYSDIRRILAPQWVVQGRDPAAMAAVIVHAERSRAQIAPVVRKWVETNATIDRSVDALEAVYAQYHPSRDGGNR